MTAPAQPAERRAMTVRREVTGVLETVTSLRVGGWGSSAAADLVVARDGLDRFVIPGTSLAGAIRSWLGTVTSADGAPLFSETDLGKVFGHLERASQDGDLCLIRVDDAVATGDVRAGIRDGVGIDRHTGTAAAGPLYQHEVIPPGSRFALRITASQAPGDPQRAGAALDLIISALAEGRVEIGAARTRGLGLIRLTGIRSATIDLTDRAQVLTWLCGKLLPEPEPARSPGRAAAPDGRLGIEISWSPVTPVMVQASAASDPDPAADRVVDIVPLRAAAGPDGTTRLLLPGSSVKGVLRSHAERIMRTLLRLADLPAGWLDQVNDDRLDPVGVLFGFAGAKAGSGHQGRRGALAVHDCHSVSSSERVVTHVAVDRWTGGAAENLLFSVREPATAEWEPIRLDLDVRRVGGGTSAGGADRALVLLLLVLRDLADGWLPIGFGGTRGRGTIGVSRVSFTGGGLPDPWASLAGHTLADLISEPPEPVERAFASWRERTRS
jgi:CRISPR/Cas system CSM-associated protein Csm3 (group 7 of RAMP superfamily)